MMHRVAVDMKFPEMFFQLSLFVTFKELLMLKAGYRELAKFAQYITYKFTQAAVENREIFVEPLFWKGTGDCYMISGRGDETKSSNKANKWTLEEEEELKTLYDQFKESEDVVGDILKNISDADRTRRKITNKLVQLELVENAHALPNPERSAAGIWSYEQEEELKTLFDQHREAEDVVGEILKCLSGAFSRQKVTNKLVRLKLVERNQLPKPRKEKPNTWTEEATVELFRLYDEFSETDDVLDNIILAMTWKKSKQAITKHLLETGKVQDSKMLRKRRKVEKQFPDDKPIYDNWSDESENDSKEMEDKKKRKVEKQFPDDKPIYDNWSDESENDKEMENEKKLQKKKNDKRFRNVLSESDTSSDEDDDVDFDVDNDKANKRVKRDQDKTNKHAKRDKPTEKISIISLAQKAREDFSQQLVWLQSRLRRAADDREEDDDWYAIPLLTITEEDDMAMSSKNFNRLLVAIGLRPPLDEQEMYWRIPENLTPTTLREFADELDKTADEFDKTADELDKAVDELGKPAVALNDTTPEELNDAMSEELNDTLSEVNSPPKAENSKREAKKASVSKRAKRRFAISDSDESADDDNTQDGGGKKEESIQQRSAKRKRILDILDEDDSNSDGENIDDAIPIHTLLSNIDKQKEYMYDVMNTQDIDDSIPLNKLLQTNENTDSLDVSNTSPCGVLRDKTNLNLDGSDKSCGDVPRDKTNLDDSDIETDKGRPGNVSSSLNEVS